MKVDLHTPIPATWALCAVLVGVHLATGFYGWARGLATLPVALVFERTERLRIAVGGQAAARVAHGEIGRLFTSVLLHGGALHLGVNVIAIYSLGRLLEPWVGRARVLGWFAAGGVAGSAASQLAHVRESDGASGGGFALLAALTVVAWRFRDELGPDDCRLPALLLAFLALNAALSFLPFVDAPGHFGGLAVGLACGAWWRPARSPLLPAIAAATFGAACAWAWGHAS